MSCGEVVVIRFTNDSIALKPKNLRGFRLIVQVARLDAYCAPQYNYMPRSGRNKGCMTINV